MKDKLTNPKVITLIFILSVSLGISGAIFFMPQSSMIYPFTPFMSYYSKISYTQKTGEAAEEAYTGITIVWLSKIFNATTVEVSELEIETELGFIPINFSEPVTYQVNLLTRKILNSSERFLYWALPYWNLINIPNDVLPPIDMGEYTSFVTGEENMIVLELVRDTKVAWYWNLADLSVAHYDKYSGILLDYKARIGNSLEIYQLQSIIGADLGIDFEYYSLMILLFALIPSLIVYIFTLGIRRKKKEEKKTTPHERAEQIKRKSVLTTEKKIKEAI